ncbi:MAG: dihydroneopterin aldolase [Burkholderiaceae bacterium]|nr:dihydroneopterin aldolase [Burkholderiaceae bacterium]
MKAIEMPHLIRVTPAPSPGEGSRENLDLIFIEGLQGQTVIGIHDDEMTATQPVRIDLTVGIPRALACSTDRLDDTLDYAALRTAVLELLQSHRCRLLEALAERIAQIALERFAAHWVRVVAVKPQKFPDVAAVGVAIERRRDPRQRDASVLHLIGAGMVPGRG